MLLLASLLNQKEKDFFTRKQHLIKHVSQNSSLGQIYELSEEVYNKFEKHIMLSDSNRAFALRATAYFLRISINKAQDKETCKAALLSCALSMYNYAPAEATRLLYMIKF